MEKHNSRFANMLKLSSVLVLLLLLYSCEKGNTLTEQEFAHNLAAQITVGIPKNATILFLPPMLNNMTAPLWSNQYKADYEELIKVNPEYLVETNYADLMHRLLISEVSILSNGNFFILNRQSINDALSELKFQMSDLVDQNKIKQLGKFLGADYFISGSINVSNIKALDYPYFKRADDIAFHYCEYDLVFILNVSETGTLRIVGSANGTRYGSN